MSRPDGAHGVFPGSVPCLLVNVSKPGCGGLFTCAFNFMVNATLRESDTQIKSAKIVPAKQPFFTAL